jgi:hypothetical protein
VCLASIRAGDGGLKGERSQLTRQLLHHSLHHWVSLIKNKYIMYTRGLQCFKLDVNQTGDKRYLEKQTFYFLQRVRKSIFFAFEKESYDQKFIYHEKYINLYKKISFIVI